MVFELSMLFLGAVTGFVFGAAWNHWRVKLRLRRNEAVVVDAGSWARAREALNLQNARRTIRRHARGRA